MNETERNEILVQFKDFLYKFMQNEEKEEEEESMKANQLQFQAYINHIARRATYYIFAYSNYVGFDAQNFRKSNAA